MNLPNIFQASLPLILHHRQPLSELLELANIEYASSNANFYLLLYHTLKALIHYKLA